MQHSLLDDLIEGLRGLPGVGPKSAQRMALHLLQRDRAAATKLGELLVETMQRVQHCTQCRIFTEHELCKWCADEERDGRLLCVVENPADVLAIEKSTAFRGRYFLLLGHLSPLDGIGPKDLGLDLLKSRLATGEIKELTLATNPTLEGQATASFITELARASDVKVMQLAQGIPIGSELEFADGGTLSVAFSKRSEV